ncbi:uncharacterized protein LOC129244176 [Anastrepha obliqua]|uniref:uncharacterized protein LOC129244176 n=1 Tax=Anastrepha obliqua TaxID=95512 RepID=UPI0024094D83|nr:uncharacterized protein LOC129244176 [Anastrepha obliqua]
MRIKLLSEYLSLFAICFTTLFYTRCAVHAASSQTTVVKHTASHDPSADGFWKRNVQWKSRWVKYWRPKAIYVSIWKKVWSPVVQNEWVPLPKVPPGWEVQKEGSTNSAGGSSSSSSGLRSAKSYSGWSGDSSSSGSIYSSSSAHSGWKKGIKRKYVRELDFE